jgi:hypothetical protein
MFAIFAHTWRTLWLEISFLDEQNINAKLAMKSHKGSQQRASQKKAEPRCSSAFGEIY